MRRFVNRQAYEKDDGCHYADCNDRGVADGGGMDAALEGRRAIETDRAHAAENNHGRYRGAEDFPWADAAEPKAHAHHRHACDSATAAATARVASTRVSETEPRPPLIPECWNGRGPSLRRSKRRSQRRQEPAGRARAAASRVVPACVAAVPFGSSGSWAPPLEGETITFLQTESAVIEAEHIRAAGHQRPQERRNLLVCDCDLYYDAASAGFEQTRAGNRVQNIHRGNAVAQQFNLVDPRPSLWCPHLDNGMPLGILGIAPLTNQGDLRADVFEVAKNMRRDQDGDTFGLQSLELLAKFDASDGVEPGGWFVQ